jgi:hypothetical protein
MGSRQYALAPEKAFRLNFLEIYQIIRKEPTMPPRNSLRESDQPIEQIDGEDFNNIRRQRTAQFTGPDGNVQEALLDIKDTRPDGNGNWIDYELKNIQIDRAGNPLPENPRSVILSHSGLYTTAPEQRAHCTSLLHPRNVSRTIFIGQDGRKISENRAICNPCDSWHNTIYVVLAILALGLIFGIWSGTGIF